VLEAAANRHSWDCKFETGPLLDAAHEHSLLLAAARGDPAASAQLVRSHMRLVLKIAGRYRRGNLSAQDLVSEGVVGLMEAMRRFDTAQGSRFAAYATWWIRAYVSRYALENRRMVRVPSTRNGRAVARHLRRTERALAQQLGRPASVQELAAAMGVTSRDVIEVQAALNARDLSLTPDAEQLPIPLRTEAEDPEQALERAQQQTARELCVRSALSRLSSRECRLVREQYFEEDGRSLAQLGADYGVSRQRAGQVLSSARRKLRAALEQVA
jgi:RNA polymerase sigma-32 factor